MILLARPLPTLACMTGGSGFFVRFLMHARDSQVIRASFENLGYVGIVAPAESDGMEGLLGLAYQSVWLRTR